MSMKAVVGVIIVAVLIGVLYVLFEKNFLGSETLTGSKTSSAQELGQTPATNMQTESSLINLPSPAASGAAIDESSDLLKEADGLQMRDYSTYFEELKDTVSSQ